MTKPSETRESVPVRIGKCFNCGFESDDEQLFVKRRLGRPYCRACRNKYQHEWRARLGIRASEYNIWTTMKTRCLCPTNKGFPSYGGRGIKICDRWRDSFENFYADMGKRPSKKHSIERINNDGDYEPENCRWATQKEQCNNQRTNRRIVVNGETLTMSQIADRAGLPYATIKARVKRNTPPEKLMRQPVPTHRRGRYRAATPTSTQT